ncbi:MAG: peptidylprolyl isomerase [Bacteroidales bacterium]|jgi:peptidyl-prolyl cis-trans isomerase SurA|nr:peptidylprolyl isomerase [Bacteroidales bacterium]
MKKFFLVTVLFFCFATGWAQPKSPSTIDEIIAIVGKEIIMKSELETEYANYAAQYSVMDNDNVEETKCTIFEHLVKQKLFMHQAELDSIVFTDQEVDSRVNYQINYWLSQVGGNTKMIEQAYNKSMDEIKKDMREVVRAQMIADRIQQDITVNVTITPSEVKRFFDRIPYDSLPTVEPSYEYGHIVKMPPVSEEEIAAIKTRLNDYRERVLRGEKFSMLARLYSDDPGSAGKGGELGFVERGTLYPEFEAVAFNLKSGEISQIVKTKAGYHIIQMIERRGESINVAHILLQPKPSVEEQVKAIESLDSIRNVIITEKMDFSKAALQFSDDLSKNSGGWVVNSYNNSYKFEKESIDASTFTTISKLIPGEYSQPVAYVNEDGKMAYRILYLKTKVAAHKPNLTEDYDLIKNAALEEKKVKTTNTWILNKVKITNIKINENYRNCPFISQWQIPE